MNWPVLAPKNRFTFREGPLGACWALPAKFAGYPRAPPERLAVFQNCQNNTGISIKFRHDARLGRSKGPPQGPTKTESVPLENSWARLGAENACRRASSDSLTQKTLVFEIIKIKLFLQRFGPHAHAKLDFQDPPWTPLRHSNLVRASPRTPPRHPGDTPCAPRTSQDAPHGSQGCLGTP